MRESARQSRNRGCSPLEKTRAWTIWAQLLARACWNGIPGSELERIRSFLGLGPESDWRPDSQRPDNFLPGLPSSPWYEAEAFDWTKRLSRSFPEVRRELETMAAAGFRQHRAGLAGPGEWTVFYLYYVGRKVEANCLSCPVTTGLIESIPGHEVGLAYFSRLAPGGHILPHCGPANVALRCHLGLKIPPGCRIRVTDETRRWEEGKCLIFDDSFEHEVWNPAGESRYVLIIDFFNPHLTATEKWAFSQIMALSWKARRRFRTVAAAAAPAGRKASHLGPPRP